MTLKQHSDIVGGSTASRLINCPGSFKASQALPPSSDKSSVYAEEGSFAHAVMEYVLEQRKADGRLSMSEYAQACIGREFFEEGKFPKTVMTREHLETMIDPAIDALEDLELHYGGGFDVAAIELRVKFPDLPAAFGTCDLVLTSDKWVIVADWKFGQGVPVQALYVFNETIEGHGTHITEELNAQLMYYLAGAINTKPKLFGKKRRMAIAIIQPRTDEPLTHTEVFKSDVTTYREDLVNAVITALGREPPIKRGEHCRWAPCKISCSLWTGPILGLAEAIGEKVAHPAPTDHLAQEVTPYGQYLARAKAFVDVLAPYTKAVNDQLHAFLEDGGVVPGWRLKDKAKNRQWVDEDVAAPALRALGFKEEEIWQKKLQTFTSVDKTAKKLNVDIPDALRVAPPSTETTICPTNDPAPVVDRQLAREEFSTALKRLA
jgi:hypothetical protein